MIPGPLPNEPLQIFDVTIRDGSYVIDFQFDQHDVRMLYSALDRIGLPYIEVGHGLGLNASSVRTAAAATDDEYLAAATESRSHSRFGAFFIPGIGGREHLKRARCDYGMHFIRIGCEPEKVESVLPYLEYAKELGYEVMGNFMKTYAAPAAEIGKKAALLSRHGADAVYVVDSAGGMLPDEVGEYVRAIRENCPARVGFHGHNNLELANANSVSAWRNGATLIDCSLGGLGRSSGNTRTELFIPIMKALGRPLPYDFHEILRVWQAMIRPLLARRAVDPQEVVGGYARIHSGLMGPFVEAARNHGISIERLLDAYGDRLHAGVTALSAEETAAEIANQTRDEAPHGRRPPTESLLRMRVAGRDEHTIRNTFRSLDEVLQATKILARKACLPVVGLVEIAAETPDDRHVMAEYFYHDEQYIVLRVSLGSIGAFIQVMQKYRAFFDVLVFDSNSPALRRELTARQVEWSYVERVLWTHLSAVMHHYLFSMVYQAAMDQDARNVLFVGGSADRVAAYLPPGLEHLELYCTDLDPSSLHQIGIVPLRQGERRSDSEVARPAGFDIAVLLSPLNPAEFQAVLGQLPSQGLIIDCLCQAEQQADLLQGHRVRYLPLSLRRAVTGELLNLLNAPEPAWQNGPAEFEFSASPHERHALHAA